jgi:hypothetical protein
LETYQAPKQTLLARNRSREIFGRCEITVLLPTDELSKILNGG